MLVTEPTVLSVRALECVRGERRLFADIGFELMPQTLLEVRGANGSGKTTLLRAVCGLFTPTAGAIAWAGADIRALGAQYHAHIAYLGHLNAVKDELTAVENVLYAACAAGLPAGGDDALGALRAFGLETFHALPCKALSQGQRRRVALARLQLSRERALWILDEPFNALDAAAVQITQSLLESHLEHGGMVILTTHQDVPLRARSIQRIELSA